MSGDVLTEAGHHFIGMDISTVGVPSPPPVLRATFSPCRREPPRAPHVAAWLRRVAPPPCCDRRCSTWRSSARARASCCAWTWATASPSGQSRPSRARLARACSACGLRVASRCPRLAPPFPARRHQISRSQTRHSRRLHQHIRRAVAVQRRPQRPHPGAASLHLLRDSLPRAGARCARLPAVLPGEQGTDGPDHELRHESGPVKHSTLAGTHPSFPALGQPCSEKCATV